MLSTQRGDANFHKKIFFVKKYTNYVHCHRRLMFGAQLFCFTALASCSEVGSYYGSRTLGLAHSAELSREHAERAAAEIERSHVELESQIEQMKSLAGESNNYASKHSSSSTKHSTPIKAAKKVPSKKGSYSRIR